MSAYTDAIATAPTDVSCSLLRGAEGAFGAPRTGGKTHQGVDLVANQSSADRNIYRVMATGNGVVAYARNNGKNPTDGYGYTVVIDHRNGFYTLYAHLAPNASAGIVSVGQSVAAGDVIGYLADLNNNEMSSGNARQIAPYLRIQLHFECFETPAGASSTDGLGPIKSGATLDDPTAAILAFGYNSF
jgi:murein DD-endopeptidase MepM/ murein hydrolase activator NlpD